MKTDIGKHEFSEVINYEKANGRDCEITADLKSSENVLRAQRGAAV